MGQHIHGERDYDRRLLREAKSWLLSELKGRGVEECATALMVCLPRKSRERHVGWYSRMSQFRHKARITVDVRSIRSEMGGEDETVMEVKLTCAHEYGHMVAEMLAVLGNQSALLRDLSTRWKARFGGDEEAFAEALARHLADDEEGAWEGWEEFLIDLGSGLQEVLL